MFKDNSGKPESLEIKLAVEISNGKETRILPLPFTASNYDEAGNYIGYAVFDYELDALFENRDLNCFTVNVQVYNGKGYQNIVVGDTSFSQLKDENEYNCLMEDGKIVIRRKKQIKPYINNWLVSFLCSIYRITEFMIGTLLIPLFILDGIYVMLLGNRRRFAENSYGGRRLKRVLLYAKWRYSAFCRLTINRATIKRMIINIVGSFFHFFRKKTVFYLCLPEERTLREILLM